MTKTKFIVTVLIISGMIAFFFINQPQTIPKVQTHVMHGQHAEPTGVTSMDVKHVNGVVHLLLGKQEKGQQELWYQSSSDQGTTWSQAVNVTIHSNVPAKFKRGNDARLAIQGDNIVAILMTKVEGAPHSAGPMMVMRSVDRGQHWQLATTPADWQGAHGFFAMDGNDNTINLVWLDSREQIIKGSQGLRFSQTVDGGLNWSENITLDKMTCACCWNTTSFADDGLFYVLYRDKKPSDMAIGRVDPLLNWQRLSSVGEFNWDFEGCPHIGGGLAIDSKTQQFHSTISTGQPDKVGLYYLNSDDKGQTWSSPMQLGDKSAIHSDIAVSSDGTVIAVWDQLSENGLQIFYSKSDDYGQTWSESKFLSDFKLNASHPKVIAARDQTLILWTESGEQNSSRMQTRILVNDD